MPADKSRITIIRGDDLKITVVFRDQDGQFINITDSVVYFTVKRSLSDIDDDAVLAEDISDHTEPDEGETQLIIGHEITDTLIPGIYYYDLQLKQASGTINSIRHGVFQVVADVTRRTDD